MPNPLSLPFDAYTWITSNNPTSAAYSPFIIEPTCEPTNKETEKKIDNTPKFFLHDEVKLWLKNNLKLECYGYTPQVYRGVSPSSGLQSEMQIGIKFSIDGEEIVAKQINLSLLPLLQLNHSQGIEIDMLTQRIRDLELRLDDMAKLVSLKGGAKNNF